MTNTQIKLGNESRPFTAINKMKRQGPQDTKQNNVFYDIKQGIAHK